MKMRAAVLVELGKPLEIMDNVQIPTLKTGQILVRIIHTGICHSQLMEVSGKRGEDPWIPHLLGHEATAEVIKIGDAVTKVAPSDFVVLTWIKSSGIQATCAQYQAGDLVINSGAVTTFSEYSVVSENRCVPLPEGVPFDIGSLFGCAVMTGAGIVMNTMQPKSQSSMAVFGIGGIGLSAVIAAKIHQCNPIIAVDVEETKLELAASFGATELINASKIDPVTEIQKLSNNQGLDFAVEAAGRTQTIEQAFSVVRRNGGYCVFASHPQQGEKICIDPYELICGKRLEGSWGGNSQPERDIPKFARLYNEGKLPLELLITDRYKLEQINLALDDMKAHRVGRALIDL
jgi:S-(hydroxymethyl)glutathione dehydrogenase/alcohol dehydrogenase